MRESSLQIKKGSLRPPWRFACGAGIWTESLLTAEIQECAAKLIQASWSAIRQGGELREFFRTVARKHPRHLGPRVAIVAVAHKLCVRASGSWWNKDLTRWEKKFNRLLWPKRRLCPRERLDDRQYQEKKLPEGSILETESPGGSALRRGASQVSATAKRRATYSSENPNWFFCRINNLELFDRRLAGGSSANAVRGLERPTLRLLFSRLGRKTRKPKYES